MRKIVIHWERLSLGTLMFLQATQQCDDQFAQTLLICQAIDPLINGRPLVERPVAETKAIIEAFAAEAATKIPEALAVWRMPSAPAQLPAPAVVKHTAAYTAQPGGDTTQN